MQFPNYFPENCPFKTAKEASGTVYYLVKNHPPTPEDFLSKRQKNPNKRFPKDEKECQSCGISVYTEIGDILNLRQIYPDLGDLKVAVSNLTPKLGVIQPSPSNNSPSHHTLWLAIGAEPWTLFQVIDITV